jgi:hypothetical protein
MIQKFKFCWDKKGFSHLTFGIYLGFEILNLGFGEAFPEGQNHPRALRERSLRSLLPLRSSFCLDFWRIEGQRGVHFHKMTCAFLSLQRKKLRGLCVLCGDIFFFPPEGAGKKATIKLCFWQ